MTMRFYTYIDGVSHRIGHIKRIFSPTIAIKSDPFFFGGEYDEVNESYLFDEEFAASTLNAIVRTFDIKNEGVESIALSAFEMGLILHRFLESSRGGEGRLEIKFEDDRL